MGALCSSWGPVLLCYLCCAIFVAFVLAAYILAFSHYIVTYYSHVAIALSTVLAGSTAWKQKYLLLAARSGGQFYECYASKMSCFSNTFLFLLLFILWLFHPLSVRCCISTFKLWCSSASWKSQVYKFYRSALKHLKTERVKKFDYCMPCKPKRVYFL